MRGGPAPVRWAVLLAALVGGAAGSLLAVALAPVTYGTTAIDAGNPAIAVAFLLGAIVGAGVAALLAAALGLRGSPRAGAVAGALVGLGVGGSVGLLAETIVSDWIAAYGGDPLAGALVGAVIASGLFGGAIAAAVCSLRSPALRIKPLVRLAGLAGSVGGMFAGLAGGSIGGALAQAATVCPNGYFGVPLHSTGCSAGLFGGSWFVGLWIGALVGAIAALATAEVLTLIATRGRSFRDDV